LHPSFHVSLVWLKADPLVVFSKFLFARESLWNCKDKLSKHRTKEKGAVSLEDFNTAGGKQILGALSPVYDALHLKTGIISSNSKFFIVTEGITDYYFFNMVNRYSDLIKQEKIVFLPGSGADNLKELISLSIAYCEKYLLLLDSDDKGRKAFIKYKGYFGEKEAENFFQYRTLEDNKDIVLEDLLSPEDKGELLEITSVKKLKNAIISLYFLEESKKRRFIKKLNAKTLDNLSIILEKINTH
jgi:hypothetical protein